MRNKNVPATGPRYWATIMVASVFGANMGDFVSHVLHLGHANGLLPLAVLLALILLLERRATWNSEVYYWLAIVTLRTAATNLGDLATHDFKLAYPLVIAVLAAVMAGLAAFDRRMSGSRLNVSTDGVPDTNGVYWTTMLMAGTLGTAIGDYTADGLGLGLPIGSLALFAVVAIMMTVRATPSLIGKASYWLAIVAIRSAGTTLGDFLADGDGLGLGLPVSTLASGALLAAIVAWHQIRRHLPHLEAA